MEKPFSFPQFKPVSNTGTAPRPLAPKYRDANDAPKMRAMNINFQRAAAVVSFAPQPEKFTKNP
jgi:hypothetical protein